MDKNLVSRIKGRILTQGVREESFERKVGHKTVELTEGWTKLHNEKKRDFFIPRLILLPY
jgi:hypothetical protein